MTVHLTLCGTSILDNLGPRIQGGSLAAVVRLSDPGGDLAVPDHLMRLADRVDAPLRRQLGEAALAFHSERPPDSAECDAMARTWGAGDQAVLLASDTVAGVTAALLNAELFVARQGLPARSIAVWATQLPDGANQPDCGPLDATVHVVLVRSLGAATAGQLHQGIANLLRSVSAFSGHGGLCFGGTPQGEWLLHLSGGYKAVLPYALIATGLLSARLGSVRADVHYEAADLIPVPVNRWDGPAWVGAAMEYDPDYSGLNPALYLSTGEPTPLCLALRDPRVVRLLQ